MPEVIFPGPEGRLEGRFHPGTRPRAPVAMILHSHPQAGGTMNNKIVQLLYQTYVKRGFATLRFNFRGVGKSQGTFDNGIGELSDAASALDWVQQIHPGSRDDLGCRCQLRRLDRHAAADAPPGDHAASSRSRRRRTCTISASSHPAPHRASSSRAKADEVVTPGAVQKLVDKLRTQRHITIHHDTDPGREPLLRE